MRIFTPNYITAIFFKGRSAFSSQLPKSLLEQLSKPTFSQLTNRKLIVIAGPDTKSFVQGLSSNNVNILYQDKNPKSSRVAMYSMFLTSKGKVVTDGIVLRPVVYDKGVKKLAEDELWIDVSEDTCDRLYEHLKRYTWKKKVLLNNLRFEHDAPEIYGGYSPTQLMMNKEMGKKYDELISNTGKLIETENSASVTDSEVSEEGYANILFYDPRSPKLGVRIICGKDSFSYRGEMTKSSVE